MPLHARYREDYKAGAFDLWQYQVFLGLTPMEEMRRFYTSPATGRVGEAEAKSWAVKEWDESKHPRGGNPENPGEFSSATGVDRAKHLALAESIVTKGLAESGLPILRQKEYEDVANSVFANMTTQNLFAFHSLVERIRFCRDGNHVKSEAERLTGERYSPLTLIGGMTFTPDASSRSTLILDGDAAGMVAAGLYAHEFAHAIGYSILTGEEVSETNEWLNAYRDEIQKGKLSERAEDGPDEGFAEFGRLLMSGLYTEFEVKSKYPKAYEVWKKYGLR